MHMVGYTTDRDGRTFLLFAGPGQISVSPFPKGVVQQKGLAFFRGKNEVDTDLRERLRHDSAFCKRCSKSNLTDDTHKARLAIQGRKSKCTIDQSWQRTPWDHPAKIRDTRPYTYAEGVPHQSPGSRSAPWVPASAPRNLSSAPRNLEGAV
jgi:hypothetical protein